MRRLPLLATIATDVCLLAALGAWQWVERQPWREAARLWPLPIYLSLLTLACGAVGLITSRRTNRVLMFLCNFAAVIVAAWLFNHLYARTAPTATPFWMR